MNVSILVIFCANAQKAVGNACQALVDSMKEASLQKMSAKRMRNNWTGNGRLEEFVILSKCADFWKFELDCERDSSDF
jgi:hypothetical protein